MLGIHRCHGEDGPINAFPGQSGSSPSSPSAPGGDLDAHGVNALRGNAKAPVGRRARARCVCDADGAGTRGAGNRHHTVGSKRSALNMHSGRVGSLHVCAVCAPQRLPLEFGRGEPHEKLPLNNDFLPKHHRKRAHVPNSAPILVVIGFGSDPAVIDDRDVGMDGS